MATRWNFAITGTGGYKNRAARKCARRLHGGIHNMEVPRPQRHRKKRRRGVRLVHARNAQRQI